MNKDCCSPGEIWLGTPAGSVSRLGGVQTYISTPASPSGRAAVLVHDAFGFDRLNIRLLADAYAKAGYLAVVPDLFNGDALTEDGMATVMDWLAKHPIGSDGTMATLAAVISELRLVHGIEKVAAEGFCWGGPYVASLAATDKLHAATIAHGSMITVDSVEALKQPTQFLCAEEDAQWPAEFKSNVEKALEEKDVPCTLKTYPGTAHGFAIRGVMGKVGDEVKAKMYEGEEEMDGAHTTAAAEAANDTISWWNKHTA